MHTRNIDMARTITFTMVAALTTVAAVAALVWFDQSDATANNPPTGVLGTANIDPAEPPPTGAVGAASTPVYESLEANGLFYVCLLYTSPSPRD